MSNQVSELEQDVTRAMSCIHVVATSETNVSRNFVPAVQCILAGNCLRLTEPAASASAGRASRARASQSSAPRPAFRSRLQKKKFPSRPFRQVAYKPKRHRTNQTNGLELTKFDHLLGSKHRRRRGITRHRRIRAFQMARIFETFPRPVLSFTHADFYD